MVAFPKTYVRLFFFSLLVPCLSLAKASESENPSNLLAPLIKIPSVTEFGINQPYWEWDGHLLTSGYVINLATHDLEFSQKVACYSQAPDDLWLKYSAPSVAIWGLFYWSYRQNVMEILHSLHGGDLEAVVRRQEDLRRHIKSLIIYETDEGGKYQLVVDEENVWKLGFLLHALGDSYAHLKGETGAQVAYGPIVGHGFDGFLWGLFGENYPDKIFKNNNYENYSNFVKAAYETFAEPTRSSQNRIDTYLLKIKEARFSEDPPEDVEGFLLALNQPMAEIEPDSSIDSPDWKAICEEHYQDVSFSEVRDFLEDLRMEFQAGAASVK